VSAKPFKESISVIIRQRNCKMPVRIMIKLIAFAQDMNDLFKGMGGKHAQ
jgi:hypothetical protein